MADSKCPCLTLAISLTVRWQNLIGSYPSTHSTFNLIGPCNKHPNIQSHKDIYAETTDNKYSFSLTTGARFAGFELGFDHRGAIFPLG